MTKKVNAGNGKLIMYNSSKGIVELRADTDKETIWASLDQVAELFDRDKSVISRHLKNIFNEAELDKNSVLSVGYRVNSKKATRFRIWATKTLRQYLINGIVINTDRIKKLPDKILTDMVGKIEFIQQTLQKRELNKLESDSLLGVIHDYANSWKYLKEYDDGQLKLIRSKIKEKKHLDYDYIRKEIDVLKSELMKKGDASELFASERDETFKGILKTIYQTFGGKELYSSLEEKAAHLLYFIIKDHPFSDGNKRVGAFLFIAFLKINNILVRSNGEKKINDNTLVALALLIAESNPKDKDLMVALTTNLLI